MNIKDMSNEELVALFGERLQCHAIQDAIKIEAELLSRLDAGQKAILYADKILKLRKVESKRIEELEQRDDVWRAKKEMLENSLAKAYIGIDSLKKSISSDYIQSLEAELKFAKLDSHRLVWQEKVNDDLKCCGNCKDGQYCLFVPDIIRNPNTYCPKWESDGMSREEREVK